jgi:hypothetical protein
MSQPGYVSNPLASLTDRWWDWRVDKWDSATLRLIADNDLTYHHAVEVAFANPAYVACPAEFSHPRFAKRVTTKSTISGPPSPETSAT